MPDYTGLLFIGDPHVASRPPGFRKDDYSRAILGKLRWAIDYAEQNALRPIILGDLFDFPRDNANWVLVDLLNILHDTLGIYGNHDCKENTLGENDTLSVLTAAGAVRLIDEENPWCARIAGHPVLVGGTPWGQKLPTSFDPAPFVEKLLPATGAATTRATRTNATPDSNLFDPQPNSAAIDLVPGTPIVFWLTHHDLRFPGQDETARLDCREIPGIDVVVNGHIHRPLESTRSGQTLWVNPGNIARVSRSDVTRAHVPSVFRADITAAGLQTRRIPLPHQPYEEVFHEAAQSAEVAFDESAFVKGLGALQAIRTHSGEGLMSFLKTNLPQFGDRVADEIMQLAQEVLTDAPR